MRLVQNMDIVLDRLADEYEQNENMQNISLCHTEMWARWNSTLLTIRVAKKLKAEEIEQLKVEIIAFCDVYKMNCDGTFTIKMHILAALVIDQLDLYGTIGMFCEDNLESIHAIVNSFARIYSMVPPKRRTQLILQSLHSRKDGKRNKHVKELKEKS